MRVFTVTAATSVALLGSAIDSASLSDSRAEAAPATLAAIAPSSDVRKAVPIGPHGQVYEPDGKGAWVRRKHGGTAIELVGATAVGGTVIAGARNAAPFKLASGTWGTVFLIPKAKAIVGTGERVLAAVGRQVFAIDTTAAHAAKLADAPARVSALAASKARAVVATDKGLFELVGKAGGWKPIQKAPRTVRSLVSERWAIVDKGALDLVTLKITPWPTGLRFDEAQAVGETLYVVATHGKQRELLTLARGRGARATAKAAKGAAKGKAGAAKTGAASVSFEREAIPLATSSPIVGIVADDGKRVVVAARDGKLAVRIGGAWSVVEVSEDLPLEKPAGPAPALSAGASSTPSAAPR